MELPPAFLASSSQSPSGPAGGVPDDHGPGRGAAGPRGATSAARAHCPHGTGRRRIDRTGPGGATLTARAGRRRADRPGLLRVASQDVTILMSAMLRHRDRLGHGRDRRRRCATIRVGTYASTDFDQFEDRMRICCYVRCCTNRTCSYRISKREGKQQR